MLSYTWFANIFFLSLTFHLIFLRESFAEKMFWYFMKSNLLIFLLWIILWGKLRNLHWALHSEDFFLCFLLEVLYLYILCWNLLSIFKKIYVFLERGEGREKEREISCLAYCCELNRQPFTSWDDTPPTEPRQSAITHFELALYTMRL